MKPLIKICGIKDFNTLNQLIGLDEIDFIGFIFFGKSPRNVSNDFLNEVNGINLQNKNVSASDTSLFTRGHDSRRGTNRGF